MGTYGSFTLRGVSEMKRELRGIATRLPDIARRAVLDEMYAVLDDAATNYVPIEFGDLVESGRVENPNGSFAMRGSAPGGKTMAAVRQVSAQVVFGGNGIDYAEAIHEHPSSHDPWTWVVADQVVFVHGGPKYLEIPFRKAERGMAARIARFIRSELG